LRRSEEDNAPRETDYCRRISSQRGELLVGAERFGGMHQGRAVAQ